MTMEMNRERWTIALLLWCQAALLLGQAAPAAPQRATSTVRDAYQGGWSPTSTTLEEVSGSDNARMELKAAGQLDELRLLRNELLAKTKGQLGPEDRQALMERADALERTAPNSFEAHLARYYSLFPAPDAFLHLDLATARARDRIELIGPQLDNAARLDNPDQLVYWSKAMRDRGSLAPGLRQVADDMLLSVEHDAVFLAAGEMDAYALWTRQFADGFRRDVLVIDHRLLGDPAYRQRMWSACRAQGAVPSSAKAFVDRLYHSTTRPVYLSPALGRSVVAPYASQLFATGMALRQSQAPIDNMARLQANWPRMSRTTTAGPLSQNYLMVGAVLLRHYREIGDEAKAAALEHELRGMARSLGATDRMIRLGVFEH